MVEFSSKIQD